MGESYPTAQSAGTIHPAGLIFLKYIDGTDIVKACGHMNKRGLLAESRPERARLGGIMLHSRIVL